MNLMTRIIAKLKRIIASQFGSAAYWSVYAVTHDDFRSKEQSLNHFYWRSDQYINYLNLMPVSGLDGQVVLDYGCGPGNDLVGFIEKSKTKRLIGMDVSAPSLELARKRVLLHDGKVDFIKIDETEMAIPLDNESIDYIHSSGVLHHVKNLDGTLAELHRILKPGGQLRVMVYGQDSIWFHLNTAYLQRLKLKDFGGDTPLFDIFKATTDGKECPISRVYQPSEFLTILNSHGFTGEYIGSSISMHELNILDRRFDAILDPRLEKKHRDFLLELDFNSKGLPSFHGHLAGLDACFLVSKPK